MFLWIPFQLLFEPWVLAMDASLNCLFVDDAVVGGTTPGFPFWMGLNYAS